MIITNANICFLLNLIILFAVSSAATVQIYKRDSNNYQYDNEVLKQRITDYPILKLFPNRMSSKRMSGESVTDSELKSVFEASRWTPSFFNAQEWRFVYAKRDSLYWQPFYDLLTPRNQANSANASVLIMLVSSKYMEYKNQKMFIPSHSLDAGAAWMSMALEATARGLAVLPMTGFDQQKASETIRVDPNEYNVELIIALGKPLPKYMRVSANMQYTQRIPINMFISEGYLHEKVSSRSIQYIVPQKLK